MDKIWMVILGIGIATFLMRYCFIRIWGSVNKPAWLDAFLRYVPFAVMAALVSSSLVPSIKQAGLVWNNPFIWATLAAVLASAISKSLWLTILAGLSTLWIFPLLFG